MSPSPALRPQLQPELRHLLAVERWTLLFAALLIGGALCLCGPRAQLGAGLGAGLMVGNVWLMSKLGTRLLRALTTARSPILAIVVIFNLKLAGLAVLIYLCIRYLPVDPIAFLLGVSVLPAAIFARGVQHGLRLPATETPSASQEEG